MDRRFTVLTPTFNRRDLLGRVYQNLKNQTYKNFEWLIIDDGSSDGTEHDVARWKEENLIDINYIKKTNEGKSKTLRLGFSLVKTDYVTDFDDDDEYTPDCLETFNNCWEEVESKGLSNVASIRALTVKHNGIIVGGGGVALKSVEANPPFVANYIKYNVIGAAWVENITCYKTSALREVHAFDFPDTWMGEPVTYVSEYVFWSRLAVKYDTLYINKALRLYNDVTEGITRNVNYRKRWLSSTISSVLFINDMYGRYNEAVKFYLSKTFYIGVGVCLLHLPYIEVVSQIRSKVMKLMGIMMYPLCLIYALILRYVRNQKC